jgi:HEAT repeat protein
VARTKTASPLERLPRELREALESFESCPLDEIVERNRTQDFEALREFAASGAPELDLRQRAVQGLGKWGKSQAVPAIVSFLATPGLEPLHRVTAVEALGRLGTKPARDAVIEHADDPSPDVRKFVVRALGQIGDATSKAKLRGMAKSEPRDWVKKLAADYAQAKPASAPRKRQPKRA